jgi:hypothetical protein
VCRTLRCLSTNKAVPETWVVRYQDRRSICIRAARTSGWLCLPTAAARRTYQNACIRMECLADLCSCELMWDTESAAISCHFVGAKQWVIWLVFLLYCPLLHLVIAFNIIIIIIIIIIIMKFSSLSSVCWHNSHTANYRQSTGSLPEWETTNENT